jgi:hypothetical protein
VTQQEKRLYRYVKKMLKEKEEFLAFAERTRQTKPEEIASMFTPDSLIEHYTQADWCRKTIAALESGQPIPDHPE